MFNLLDFTVTTSGRDCLREILSKPSTSVYEIESRSDQVKLFAEMLSKNGP